jgi:NTP pyrophosphatase (non-canonical NTP hydrolase)
MLKAEEEMMNLPFLTFVELRTVNVQRCEESYHGIDRWSPTDWACAFAGEAGEACNAVKKLKRLETNPELEPDGPAEHVERIADELADAIIYADLLAARLRIDLGAAVRRKFNEVSDRVGSPHRL